MVAATKSFRCFGPGELKSYDSQLIDKGHNFVTQAGVVRSRAPSTVLNQGHGEGRSEVRARVIEQSREIPLAIIGTGVNRSLGPSLLL